MPDNRKLLKEFGDWKRFHKLLASYEGRKNRGDALQLLFARKIADLYAGYVTDRIPDSFKSYRDSIVVKDVSGVKDDKGKKVATTVVMSDPTPQDLRDLPVDNTLVTFVVNPVYRSNMSPVTSILKSYEPWTLDTLPVMPPTREVKVVYRVASPQEYMTVKKRIDGELSTVRGLLLEKGVAIPKGGILKGRTNAIGDMANLALKLEFGLAGFPRVAHWRPAVQELKVTGFTALQRDRQLQKTLDDPSYMGWRNLPSREKIRVREVQKISDFQDKINPKIGV